jgi:hypothetical protein
MRAILIFVLLALSATAWTAGCGGSDRRDPSGTDADTDGDTDTDGDADAGADAGDDGGTFTGLPLAVPNR